MSDNKLDEIMKELRKPFLPSQISWKPGAIKGERALALAYADLRAYMNRLDEVCGSDWSIEYEPWGNDRIICRLTICGITRSSTGEMSMQDEKSEIGGTVAEAQAAKRAATMFGLGRYLYTLPSGWEDIDPKTKQFTARAKAKLMGILAQHYRRATNGDGIDAENAQEARSDTEDPSMLDSAPEAQNGAQDAAASSTEDADNPFDALTPLQRMHELGRELYGEQWEQVCKRNVKRVSDGEAQKSSELTPQQIGKLIAGMEKLRQQRKPGGESVSNDPVNDVDFARNNGGGARINTADGPCPECHAPMGKPHAARCKAVDSAVVAPSTRPEASGARPSGTSPIDRFYAVLTKAKSDQFSEATADVIRKVHNAQHDSTMTMSQKYYHALVESVIHHAGVSGAEDAQFILCVLTGTRIDDKALPGHLVHGQLMRNLANNDETTVTALREVAGFTTAAFAEIIEGTHAK